MEVTTVFLSSTYTDLQEERNAAREVLAKIDRVKCVDMESFGARSDAAGPYCHELVAESDLFVGLLGHCYGSCPADAGRSFTEAEFDAAIEAARDKLVFLLADDAPARADEPPEARQKQQAFRSRVRNLLIVDVFTNASELALKISLSVNNWLRRRDLERYGAALVTGSRSLGSYYGRVGNACLALAVVLAGATMSAAVLSDSLGPRPTMAAVLLFVAAMILGVCGFVLWDREREALLAPQHYIDEGAAALDRLHSHKRNRK